MSQKRRKRSRRSLRRQRRRRLLIALGIGAFLLLIVVGFAYQTLQREQTRLAVVTTDVEAVVADADLVRDPAVREEARRTLRGASAELKAASSRLRGSISLRLLAVAPVLGRQRGGVLELVDDGAEAADVGIDLLDALDAVEAQAEASNAQLPLDALRAAQTALADAASRLAVIDRGTNGLIGPLREARSDLDDVAGEQGGRLGRLADQLDALHGFLGGEGSRRYFLALENNAEMRSRGMVLSFAELALEDGRVDVSGAASVDDVEITEEPDIDLPPGTEQVFGNLAPTRLFQSVNATADFAVTGRSIQAMYRQARGTEVDGVIGLDVVALARMLAVVGPVTVPEVGTVDSGNVADVLLRDLYAELPYGPQTARRERLAVVAAGVAGRLTGGGYDVLDLGETLAAAATEGHVRLWSAAAEEEEVFEKAGVAGSVGLVRPDRTFHVTVQNATATKLDYFVRPSVDMEVIVTPEDTAIVRTTVTVDNRAPVDADSSYQLGPDRVNSFTPGEYVSRVYLWGPAGAGQSSAVEESGLQVTLAPTRALPGTSSSVTFETVIDDAVRNGRLDLRLVPQPRLHPMRLKVRVSAPGRTIQGEAEQTPEWVRPVTVSWRFR